MRDLPRPSRPFDYFFLSADSGRYGGVHRFDKHCDGRPGYPVADRHAANPAFAELLGRDLDVTIGLRLDDYLEGDRLATSKIVVDALRRGWMDSCEGEAEFLLGDGSLASTFTWSIPLGTEPPHDALLMGAAPVRTERPTGFEAHRVDPTMIVLGVLDQDWSFTDLSVQAVDRLGGHRPRGPDSGAGHRASH